MLAYRHGDTDAFEHLYHRHKNGLFAFLYRSLPRPALVEEIAQETWFAVVNAAGNYEPGAKFKTWLYRIARNQLIDHTRRRDNHLLSLDVDPSATDAQVDPKLPDEKEILGAVAELPADQRDALLLREQGFSVSEVAEITGVATETVKSRIRYGRKQLKKWLGEQQ